MKHFLLPLFVVLISFSGSTQNKDNRKYDEILEQVWKPFKKSFDNKDYKTFNKLHTDDILRINSWGIKKGEVYKNGIKKSYQKTSKRTRTIEFWIEQSVFSETIAHQIGYYAVTYKEPNKKDKTTYAQFQVTLLKINGHWKISQDFDTELVGGKKVDASFVKNLKKLEL
ncbi:MAG: nuclear transport factor 2 family protein [Flavobacteriaceae bacterium]|nr:nuclear transport factor 2 family protein [Flavobacteriaceae bacterium]